MPDHDPAPVDLCPSEELTEGGLAFGFDVVFDGETCRAFAVRFEGQPHAYLNRCTHVAIELDYQPGRIFDDTGQWLLCATHGAVYAPDTGDCAGGPCNGGLVKIALTEADGMVRWHPTPRLQPVAFD
ncbi:Rieske (2Fe-2S) protein [Comamonadaceae bacterium OH2545_COT-014]|nr:Rieske (2Fe-2S) protein [Comamonadaceae bacterium OH2545_COT-014]